jgi:hypothetical protein
MQVEETPQSEMVRTFVHLQEGHVIEGDKHTSLGIAKALEKYVPPDGFLKPQMHGHHLEDNMPGWT